MEILVIVLSVIAALIVTLLIIALFTKKEYAIENEVIINKPKQEVFNYIKFTKNLDNYNKWVMADPNMKKNFKGTDGTVGFIYAWDGNRQVGKGEQEIKRITEGEKIDLELRFIKPFEGTSSAWLTTELVSEKQTKVKWGMSGENPYPRNVMNLFMKGLLGKDLQTSLNILKSILEKNK